MAHKFTPKWMLIAHKHRGGGGAQFGGGNPIIE